MESIHHLVLSVKRYWKCCMRHSSVTGQGKLMSCLTVLMIFLLCFISQKNNNSLNSRLTNQYCGALKDNGIYLNDK